MSSSCPLELSSSCPLIVLYLSSTSVGINKTSKHHRTTNKVPTGNAFTKVAALRDSPLQRLTPAVGKTKNIPRWPPSGLAFSYGCGLAGGYAAQVGALLCQHRCAARFPKARQSWQSSVTVLCHGGAAHCACPKPGSLGCCSVGLRLLSFLFPQKQKGLPSAWAILRERAQKAEALS